MDKERRYYPAFHLGPMAGWLNDPNGLCQLSGVHHIFFQYSPDDPRGGNKCWGHYETKDFVTYRFTGTFMRPDTNKDRDGVYSGCALVKDGEMYLFFTGNVKHPGEYDYIREGREANTMLVISKDGMHASAKRCLMTNRDYPSELSCHVRDPKVFSYHGRYYMVQGARTLADEGCVVVFASENLVDWVFLQKITRPNFGYMWECPDVFWLDGNAFLSVSPQGLASEKFRFQNVYQSGYFPCGAWTPETELVPENFYEWDYGFDFYAPQTYMDETGRRILIGWMGVPDAIYDHDPSIEEGWQHMLTLPRRLSVDDKTGRIRQTPLPELSALRVGLLLASRLEGECMELKMECGYELLLSEMEDSLVEIDFCDGLTFAYDATLATCRLKFTKDAVGYGRDERRLRLASGKLSNLRVFVDRCSIELFINDGEEVMTTKYFPTEAPTLRLRACALAQVWELAECKGLQ